MLFLKSAERPFAVVNSWRREDLSKCFRPRQFLEVLKEEVSRAGALDWTLSGVIASKGHVALGQ